MADWAWSNSSPTSAALCRPHQPPPGQLDTSRGVAIVVVRLELGQRPGESGADPLKGLRQQVPHTLEVDQNLVGQWRKSRPVHHVDARWIASLASTRSLDQAWTVSVLTGSL